MYVVHMHVCATAYVQYDGNKIVYGHTCISQVCKMCYNVHVLTYIIEIMSLSIIAQQLLAMCVK